MPKNFDGSFLTPLLSHEYGKIRLLAAKNIAKLTNFDNTAILLQTYQNETDTGVKREIVSAIGRMRNPGNKKILIDMLEDNDPKIVCQAIRGLLVFKNDSKVTGKLKPLKNHQNEMVRAVIYKEFFAEKSSGKNVLRHPQSYDYLKNVVVNDDVLQVLKYVSDESVHLTFTSPPYYNARDYSIYSSYQDYLEFLEKVFKETYRITKEGRFLIVNTSPIIIPRVSRSHSSKRYPIPFDLHSYLVKMGWEFIDDIIWLKPESSVKNRIGGFMQHRKPLAYKPNPVTEYLMVYRKQTEKLLDWNMRSYDLETVNYSKVPDGYETSNVWKIDPTFDKIHSAVFPAELCRRVIQYYSFKGDLVFDPFAGSGTVGTTAKSLCRFFLLTEQEKTYFDYIKEKLGQETLFDQLPAHFYNLKKFKEHISQNKAFDFGEKQISSLNTLAESHNIKLDKHRKDFFSFEICFDNQVNQMTEVYFGTVEELFEFANSKLMELSDNEQLNSYQVFFKELVSGTLSETYTFNDFNKKHLATKAMEYLYTLLKGPKK
ncbi:DNA methyltransferase [Desulfococcaceae bacterium HSG9]|nr:DNA methyltransferase [Desulfococcaceae bacterium HSG9]